MRRHCSSGALLPIDEIEKESNHHQTDTQLERKFALMLYGQPLALTLLRYPLLQLR